MRSEGRVVGSVCLCVCYSTSHFSNACSSHKRYDRPMKVRSFERFYLKITDIRIFRFPFPISHFSFPVLRSRFVPRFSPLVSRFTFSLRVSRFSLLFSLRVSRIYLVSRFSYIPLFSFLTARFQFYVFFHFRFSRKLLWLRVGSTNHDPSAILYYFLEALEEHNGYIGML